MTQPRTYYEGRLAELQESLRWPNIKAEALALRYATFKGYQEGHEHNSKCFQASVDRGTEDRIIPVLVHLEAGRASTYVFLCALLRPYLDEGMTEHQLKVFVARVEQEIAKTKLLLLGEEP